MTSTLLLPLSVALLLPTARAEGVDAHGFNLAALTDDPRAPLQVQRPTRFDQWDFFVGGVFEYAHEPLVRVEVIDGEEQSREAVLDNIVALNLDAGLAFTNWLRLDVAMPLYLTSTGTDALSNGFGVGDMRVAAMVEIVRPNGESDGSGFGLGLVPYLDIPLGNSDQFLGQGGITGGGKAALTYGLDRLTLGADAGIQFQPEVTALDNLVGSDRVLLGAHIGYLFAPTFGANLEGKVYVPFGETAPADGTDTPAEVALSLKKRLNSGLHFLAGASTAVSQGASAADFRVFLGAGFGNVSDYKPKVTDRDNDGIPDDKDACPDDPETVNGVRDDDGCPEKPATLAVTVTYEGKPVTGADIEVKGGAAPMTAKSTGSAWKVDAERSRRYDGAATYGSCLAGSNYVTTAEEGQTDMSIALKPVLDASVIAEVVDPDGKPIPDAIVSWTSDAQGCVPKDQVKPGDKVSVGAGNHTATARAAGYRPGTQTASIAKGESKTVRIQLEPTQIKVTDKQIMILAPVFFDYDKDTIKPESFAILNDVAQTMTEHPELLKVEVAGHTDSDGSDKYNTDLSQRRVESVRRYLIEKGIDGNRLVAKGYGESKPIASNKTEEGKAKNRRVEFVIVERQPPAGQGAGKNR